MLLCYCVRGQCGWRAPTSMFPKRLLQLEIKHAELLQRRLRAIYKIDLPENSIVNTITGATSEKNAHLSKYGNALGSKIYRNFTKGLDNRGHTQYSIFFDKAFASKNMIYTVKSVQPSGIYHGADLTASSDKIHVLTIHHNNINKLEFADRLVIWLEVRSPCLPEHVLATVPYDFEVKSMYDLFHGFNSSLSSSAVWSERGWVSQGSVVLYPSGPLPTEGSFVGTLKTPCDKSRMYSSLEVFNTSLATYWDIKTRSYQTNTKFIGSSKSIPRCHRYGQGNVCFVVAKVRFVYGDCKVPVKFSVFQSVSHISRMSTKIFSTSERPSNFNATRRKPVRDHLDMRYDMCESRACQDETTCTPFHIENTQLMHDTNLTIRQHDVITTSYIETECIFQVFGFIDDIWSPHFYFRQWVGFDFVEL